MNQLFYDFETFWADDYTLSKMTAIEYILSPRFEALGCGFATEAGDTLWVDGPDLPAFFARVDWSSTFAIGHNALFDALILSNKYGVVPGLYGCTMSMAKNWISHATEKVSLAACSQYYMLPPKMDTAQKLKGLNFHAISQQPELHQEMRTYGVDDAVKCRQLYRNFMKEGFPRQQLEIIDMTIRMAALPQFELDPNVLHEHLAEVKAEKQRLLDEAQLTERTPLMSNDAFAGLLLVAGVTAPMKTSKKGNEIYAFAKTDKAFTALLDHEDPWVQALVAARLGHKSTQEETRTQRLIDISRVTTRLPVPLLYSGAHTHRFSGGWKINLQNLPKGGRLRQALRAPSGYAVVSVDASQIEARINATLSRQTDLIEGFRSGVDVYAQFAAEIYRHPVNKQDHERERTVGKVAVLSLGYGASPPVFQSMCRTQGKVLLSDADAANIVYIYRQRYQAIVENWKHADRTVLPWIAAMADVLKEGGKVPMWGPVGILKNSLWLPSGNLLRYSDLRHEMVTQVNGTPRWQWIYSRAGLTHTVYGSKLVENVCQALAFIHIMEVALRVKEVSDGMLLPAHQVHDELIYIVPEAYAEGVSRLVVAEMSKSPPWMEDAPLAAEGHVGVTYGDTK
jgi:DNA polymerase I-like protein with 3'-5' exonuclease and polymerase domains